MSGGTQSASAVVCRGTLVPPAPSSASMYCAVIVSPLAIDRIPFPATGGPASAGIVPTYLSDPGAVAVRMTVSGVGSVFDQIVAVVVSEPMLASWTVT